MRISDWSSDVCSSDLFERAIVLPSGPPLRAERRRRRMVAHHIFTPALALAASALAFSTPASAQLLGGSGGLGGGLGGSLGGTLGSRSEEHTSELQSLMRISYAVFCLKKKTPKT